MRRIAALLGLSLLLAACGADAQDPDVVQSTASNPSASASLAPEPEPEPTVPTTSPYSGREGGVDTPVMVVKFDNTTAAQPHRGLTSADVVYVEPVEGGLTRIAAVFSTHFPKSVGPVRSARISDIDLFAQYGKVAFVFSGAQRKLWPKIEAANWIPISQDGGSPGFYRERGTGRYAPTNLMADTSTILDEVEDEVVHSADMGLHFDVEPPAGGKKARTVTATWSSASVQFRWNAKKDAYDVWMNGRQARDTDKPGVQRATTAIIQYVKQVDSGYGDKFGGITPLAVTVGSGKGLMIRDGRAHKITWERPSESDPTSYLDAEGNPIVLHPGQVWVVLVDRTRKASVG
jgi:hypothetical protein